MDAVWQRDVTAKVTINPSPSTKAGNDHAGLAIDRTISLLVRAVSLSSRHIGQWNRAEFSNTVSRAVVGTAVT
jgi:hypothetical protein